MDERHETSAGSVTGITVLAGGVGSARFCAGLVRAVDPATVTIVVNTGDDERIRGLYVSPDIDTVLYHLAGLSDWGRGWGLAEETFAVNDRYRELAAHVDGGDDLQDWFTLGDRDLATHLLRTRLLDAGRSLAEATDALRRSLGVPCRVLPASIDPLRTVFRIEDGTTLSFQDYFVRRHQQPRVIDIGFEGTEHARPAPGVLESMRTAGVVLIPPSNPLISVAPLLSVPGLRDGLASHSGTRIAISPIVGGRALKGPADRLMASFGHEVSPVGVAKMYRGLIDVFVVDETDRDRCPEIEELGIRTMACDTIMRSANDAAVLARRVLEGAPV